MVEIKQKKRINELLKEHKTEIIIATGFVSTVILGYVGYKYIMKTPPFFAKTNSSVAIFDKLTNCVDDVEDSAKSIVEKTPRYLVEFKAFKTGEWYSKTRTDYINSAYSVASCNNYGRAYRIIDTETNAILKEVLEDGSMASCNGYANGYHW